MNVECTIQEMFDTYPTLFKERADCLNHLFCVIGNGYYWENGELVDSPNDSGVAKICECHLVNGKAYQHNKLSLRDECYFNNLVDRSDEVMFVKWVLSRPDNVYHKYPRYKRWGFYLQGYCEYAKLFNYPDDIKKDWLDAIEECKCLLAEDGYDLITPIDTTKNIADRRIDEIERYKQSLERRKLISQADIDDFIEKRNDNVRKSQKILDSLAYKSKELSQR